MPLDFPNTPTDGDIFNGAGVSWRWDGTKWTSVLSAGGPFLPLTGGTVTGPLYWTATGGNTSRSAQDRAVEAGVSVMDFGAKCDGVTNDTAALTSAFSYAVASGGKTVLIPAGKCCFLPNGITVPSGVTLEGLSFFANTPGITGGTAAMSPPSSSILTNANINSVTLGSGGNLQAVTLRNLVVRTNAASAPTAGAGVYVNTGLHVRCENVLVHNAYDGFYWKAIATNGIIGWMDGCHTNQISGHHVVQDTWPELRLNMCRFTGYYGARAYVFMTGGQSGNILPNGYFATNCHYNESGTNVDALLLIGGMVAGAGASAQELSFVNCHAEHYNYAVRTDATETYLMKIRFIGCGLFSMTDFFHLDPATAYVAQLQLLGNDIEGPSFTMGPAVFQECQVVGNNIGSNVVLNSNDSGSTLAFLANGVVGNLTLSGAWGGLAVDASVRGGTFSTTATGNVVISVPGIMIRSALASSTSYANDTTAAAGGVQIGQEYRNGSVRMVRVT